MHFLTIVAIPPGAVAIDDAEGIHAIVERLMAPYDENENRTTWVPEPDEEEGGYWTNDQSFWDWWVIGGRWTGRLSDYDPTTDKRNWERCTLCIGTPGFRNDELGKQARAENPDYGCNGCNYPDHPQFPQPKPPAGLGLGWRLSWSYTEDVPPGANWARLGDVRERLEADPPYYLVHEGVSRKERRNPDWNGKWGDEGNGYYVTTDEVDKELVQLSDDCIVVVVDCHS